jgi:hypothetical protein
MSSGYNQSKKFLDDETAPGHGRADKSVGLRTLADVGDGGVYFAFQMGFECFRGNELRFGRCVSVVCWSGLEVLAFPGEAGLPAGIAIERFACFGAADSPLLGDFIETDVPGPMPQGMFDPMPEVIATFEDGSIKTLFAFYPDEVSFRASEFVGLTEEDAHSLFQQKDTSYLRS